jgi:hypothetical protein
MVFGLFIDQVLLVLKTNMFRFLRICIQNTTYSRLVQFFYM